MNSSESSNSGRLFVPLASDPYDWFRNGSKQWELRRAKRQFSEKHVRQGRRVELRRGYRGDSLWGRISEVVLRPDLATLFVKVEYGQIIPTAQSREEAIEIASTILSLDPGKPDELIAFKIQLDDELPRLLLLPEYLALVREGGKRSTIRAGVRDIHDGLLELKAGPERLRVNVTNVRTSALIDLSDADAKRDGFKSLSALLAALRKLYPDLAPGDPVTLVEFELP